MRNAVYYCPWLVIYTEQNILDKLTRLSMGNSLSNVLAKLNAFQVAFYVDILWPLTPRIFSQGPLLTIKTLNRKDLTQGGLTSGFS